MTCPNLSHPTYQTIKNRYGNHAQYVVAALFDKEEFIDWKGDDEIPGLDYDGNVLSNSGSTFSISTYLDQVLNQVQATNKIDGSWNETSPLSKYYEALSDGTLIFRKSSPASLQKLWTSQNTSEKFVKDVAERLKSKFGVDYSIITDSTKKWAGKFEDGIATINLAYASDDTPFHEFAHPFVETIRLTNGKLYDNLVREIRGEGSILARTKSLYPELIGDALFSEAIVQAIGEYSVDDLKSPTLIQYIKEALSKIADYLGDLFNSRFLLPAELPADMTLRHVASLMNAGFNIPVMTLEGMHLQKVAKMEDAMEGANAEQVKAIQKLLINSSRVTLDEPTHTYTDGSGISYTPTTTAIGSTWTGDNNIGSNSLIWGNQADRLLSNAIRGEAYEDTPNLKEDSRQKLITYFESLVKELTKDGSKLVTQAVLSDVSAGIAGSADLIQVHPDGSISIHDLKTSMTSTMDAKYDKAYSANGLTRSKRDQHSHQLGMYKALAEDMGLRVNNLNVIPVKLDVLGDDVFDVTAEPRIAVQSPEVEIMTLLANRRKNGNLGSPSQKDYSKTMDKLRILIQEKIDKLEKALVRKSGAPAQRLAELKGLQETLIGTNAVKEISKVIDTIHTELVSGKAGKRSYSDKFDLLVKNVENSVASGNAKDIKGSLNDLNHYFNYVQDYKGLEDLFEIYADSVKGKVKAEEDSPLGKLKDIINTRDAMEAQYYKSIRPLMAVLLGNEINDKANDAALAFFDKKNKFSRLRDLAKAEGRDATAASFQKQMDEVEKTFKKLYTDKAKLIDQLTTTSGDLGMFEFLTGTLSNSADNILGLFSKKIKATFARVDEVMFKFQHEAAREFNEFAKATGRNQNRPDEFNAGLYEMVNVYTKNETGDYVSHQEKHFVNAVDTSKYNAALNQMFQQADKISSDVRNETRVKHIREWFEKNHIPRPQKEIDEILEKKEIELSKGYITRVEYDAWYEKNVKTFNGTTSYVGELSQPNPTYYSSVSYEAIQKNPAMKKYYDFLIKSYMESQEKYPYSKRMGYRLPSIPKQLEDKIREKGGWKNLLPNLKDSILSTDKDSEIYGFGNKVVPTYFTQYMEVGEVSNDLIGSITRFTQAAGTYEAIAGNVDSTGLEVEALALLNILKNRDIEQTDSKMQSVVKEAARKLNLTDAEIDKKGGLYAAFFEHFIDQNLYGVGEDKWEINVPKVTIAGKEYGGGTIDTAKVTNKFMGLASWPALGGPFTILKAIANKLNAEANVLIEAVGGQYLSLKGLKKGKSVYNKWVTTSMMKDYNSAVPSSIEGQLMEWYSPIQGEFRDKVGQDLSWNGFKKAFVPGSWFFLQKAGEHSAQMGMFFGIMSETMVEDGKGNKISLLSAYEQGKDGMLKLKAGIKWTDKDKDNLTNRIHAVNKSLHGVYNKMDKSVAQKQSIGRLAFMYRKFLVPAVKRRWAGIKTDQELGDTVEGFHRTIIRTAWQDKQELLAFYMGKSTTLTPMEQANIRRATMELGLVITLSTMIALMSGMADDDENLRKGKGITGWIFNSALYEAMRLNSEFKFFLPGVGLGDNLRVFTSPSAANSTLQKLYKFGHQLTTGPFETYDQNSRWHKKGDSKLGASVISLLGVYSIDPIRALEQFNKLY